MPFEEAYFRNRKYTNKEWLVQRHVLEVLGWASKACSKNLLNGEGKKALDVGCALGYTSQVLTGLGYQTSAFDVSAWGVKQAKQNAQVDFLVADAQTGYAFKEDLFDLVVCFDVLEHLASPEKALQNMFSVCRGVIVCTTPNKKVEKTIRKITGDYDETHISVKTPAQWQKIIKDNLDLSDLQVAAFHDFAGNFLGKRFFKSISIPSYGLTVRIMIKK
jgi:2-polyprenyl-3-methyl-5-hydroxy-6-metoxy-1,4-benzoquinol methylase